MSLVGSQIGRFRLLRLLGRGGMGEVYLAEDGQLRRQVAIKVIQTEYPDPDAARLFQREARAIAMLEHPHILPLFDFGEASIQGMTLTYMVMPFCKEGTLADWMQQRKNAALPSPQDVGLITQQAANALQYAHNHQIVHQDVKPSNFLIRSSEDASNYPDLMLADFGVAKSTSTSASVSQSVRGTPTYMAPEQWEGTSIAATDQYALAIMAYDLLTGRPPFQGSLGQVMYQHLRVTPQPPSTHNPHIPTDLDKVILYALAKKPEERFGSISAFARAFQQALKVDSSSPIQANVLHEPKDSDIRANLVISEAEALTGTVRTLTLPGGRRVSVAVPAGTRDGQIIHVEEQIEPASEDDVIGALILTIMVAAPEERVFLADVNNASTVIDNGPVPNSNSDVTVISGSVPVSKGVEELAHPSRPTAGSKNVNRRYGLTAILLVGLALLIAVGSSLGVFYFTRSNQQNPTLPLPTSTTQQIPYPPFGTLALDDPLKDNTRGYNWSVESIGIGTCAFSGGAYHVNAVQSGVGKGCLAKPHFSDFAYQMQMKVVKGEGGLLLFRDDSKGSGYYVFIRKDRTYELGKYRNCDKCEFTTLLHGSSSVINVGQNQNNLVVVVARGNKIDLYVNNQYISRMSDDTYTQGRIGVAVPGQISPGEVVFSNAKVWV